MKNDNHFVLISHFLFVKNCIFLRAQALKNRLGLWNHAASRERPLHLSFAFLLKNIFEEN